MAQGTMESSSEVMEKDLNYTSTQTQIGQVARRPGRAQHVQQSSVAETCWHHTAEDWQ